MRTIFLLVTIYQLSSANSSVCVGDEAQNLNRCEDGFEVGVYFPCYNTRYPATQLPTDRGHSSNGWRTSEECAFECNQRDDCEMYSFQFRDERADKVGHCVLFSHSAMTSGDIVEWGNFGSLKCVKKESSGYRYYRLDVSKTPIDDHYWCLEELSFYDMDGNRITTDPAYGSAETQYSSTYNAGMAFNELTGGDGPGWENYYCSTYGKSEGWLQYDFQSATAISKYAIERLNYWGNHWSPVDWKFEASSDGVIWVTLDDQSGITEWTDGEVKEFSIGQTIITESPSFNPTSEPSFEPTLNPTESPSFNPTSEPNFAPTLNYPTKNPVESSCGTCGSICDTDRFIHGERQQGYCFPNGECKLAMPPTDCPEKSSGGYRYYRLDVSKTPIDDQYWCLEELSFYDMDGNRITTDPTYGSSETQYSSTYNAGMAFNELTGGDGPGWENYYCSTYGKSEGWLQYDFQSATAISKYAIERLNYWGNHWSLVDWKFEASSDGVSWVSLDQQYGITEWTDGEVKEFSIVSRRRMKAESSLERLLKRFV